MAELKEDVRTYLARIRKTIADSKNMVAQAELRIVETDRMLERQGLTREQVMAMQFSDAQKRAVDAWSGGRKSSAPRRKTKAGCRMPMSGWPQTPNLRIVSENLA